MESPSRHPDTYAVNPGSRPSGNTVMSGNAVVTSVPDGLPEAAPLPERLGPYQVRGVLGRGGMGVVYSGYDPGLDRLVAVKVLAPVLASNPEYRQRFLREARAMAKVEHRNVAHVHFAGEDGGAPFFAMEFIQGESAQDRLGSGPMAVDHALDIILQAASGLQAAHQSGIIHRDVKPSNLMCATDGTVKVLDFGLARAPSEAHLTATDMIMGSPDYMSPEQGRGQEPDHRSDIYGLGATLYHLLAGAPPFEGRTPLAIIQQQIHEAPRALDQVRTDIPERVCRLVEKMMSKNPDRRQQGYMQLMMDVASLRESAEGHAFREWHENSPHNDFAAFTHQVLTRPAEVFAPAMLGRPLPEVGGVIVRTAAMATLMHALFVPETHWGPHQIVIFGMFAVGMPHVTRLADRVACRLMGVRATGHELLTVEAYTSVCLMPFFLMPRVTFGSLAIVVLTSILYLRARATGISLVTHLAWKRALLFAVATSLAASLTVGAAMTATAHAFSELGFKVGALPPVRPLHHPPAPPVR